jgi:hypothetical protein
MRYIYIYIYIYIIIHTIYGTTYRIMRNERVSYIFYFWEKEFF